MIFHEIYGSYFKVVAAILKEACAGELSEQRLHQLVQEHAFAESALTIPAALKGEWHLLTQERKPTIQQVPPTPMTTLELRWLKALLSDPRIKLFGVTQEGLEEVAPLYAPEVFQYFDRYGDGDPYEAEDYIANFKTVLAAIRHKQVIEVTTRSGNSGILRRVCYPWHLEYSSKDDKFRLLATTSKQTYIFNLARIQYVDVLGEMEGRPREPYVKKRRVVLELVNERNALERALLHFSHLEKETLRLEDGRYQLTLYYDKDDETELLIRVLSFGPMLQVSAPERFRALIQERLKKQQVCALR